MNTGVDEGIAVDTECRLLAEQQTLYGDRLVVLHGVRRRRKDGLLAAPSMEPWEAMDDEEAQASPTGPRR